MNNFDRKELARKYFIPIPETPISAYLFVIVGVSGLVLGLIAAGGIGALLVLAGLVGIGKGAMGYLRYRRAMRMAMPRASDAQMDAWLSDALGPIIRTGFQRLNVHPTEIDVEAPNELWRLPFVGIPVIEEVQGNYLWARGADDQLRFSVYKIVVVYLSNWRMPVYACNLDIITGATFCDSTLEYSLNHVEGMETTSDRITIYNQTVKVPPNSSSPQPPAEAKRQITSQTIRLKVSGESAVRFYVGIAENEQKQVESIIGMQASSTDHYISTLREHLRTRHNGAIGKNPNLNEGIPTSEGTKEVGPGQLGMPGQYGSDFRALPEPKRHPDGGGV